MNFDPTTIGQIAALVDRAQRVVITCHVSPDGDALGSSLALWHVLRAMGKRPAVFTPDTPTASLMFLPGAQAIMPASRYCERARVHFQAADLIFCLDYNEASRLDRMAPLLALATAPKVMIDHHLHPEPFADIAISRPECSSTCLLLWHVMKACGWQQWLSQQAAECIYTGMMTDTGAFTYNHADPLIYLTIAELLHLGIDPARLYTLAFNTKSLTQIQLNAYALDRKLTLYPTHRAALMWLSMDELNAYSYQKGDLEGLVNVPLAVPDVTWSVLIRQVDPEKVNISMRSKGHFPVNTIATEQFGGGGHLNAAGAEDKAPLHDVVTRLIDAMPLYDHLLP